MAPHGMPHLLAFIDMTSPLLVTSSIFDITLFTMADNGSIVVSQVSPILRPTPLIKNLSLWLKAPWPTSLLRPRPARGAHPARRADRRHPALSF